MPRSLRDWHRGALVVLGVLCASYWFGNSGTGLAVLWWEGRRRAGLHPPSPELGLQALEQDDLVFAHVGNLRIVVIGARTGRHEVFRDELAEVAWTRLRRRCVGIAQAGVSSERGWVVGRPVSQQPAAARRSDPSSRGTGSCRQR